jgi:amidase
LTQGQYEVNFKHMREVSRGRGIDYILEKYGVDIIIGPADSFLSSLAACSGTYPVPDDVEEILMVP